LAYWKGIGSLQALGHYQNLGVGSSGNGTKHKISQIPLYIPSHIPLPLAEGERWVGSTVCFSILFLWSLGAGGMQGCTLQALHPVWPIISQVSCEGTLFADSLNPREQCNWLHIRIMDGQNFCGPWNLLR
jgi:hypothetical protein